MTRPALAAAVLLVGMIARPATAQEDANARARVHFDAGTRFYEMGDYERAIAEWQASYELTALPELLYNMYTAYERLGEHREAADHLERFIESGHPEAQSPELRARLRAARARAEREADAEAADADEATDADEASEATGEPDALPPATRPPERGPGPMTIAGWTTVGFAGAAAVTFAIFAGLASSEYGSIESGCGADASCTGAQVSDLRAFNTVADVSLALSLVAGAAGVVLLLVGDPDEPAEVALVPGGVRLRGTF